MSQLIRLFSAANDLQLLLSQFVRYMTVHC